jgi:hypothetical protein
MAESFSESQKEFCSKLEGFSRRMQNGRNTKRTAA